MSERDELPDSYADPKFGRLYYILDLFEDFDDTPYLYNDPDTLTPDQALKNQNYRHQYLMPELKAYIQRYYSASEQNQCFVEASEDFLGFVKREAKLFFQEYDSNKFASFLKVFCLGKTSKYTASDVATLLELKCIDPSTMMYGGGIVPMLADHQPVLAPASKRPYDSLDPELSDGQKLRKLLDICEVMFRYGANPNDSFVSAGSGDAAPLSCYELLILNQLGRSEIQDRDEVLPEERRLPRLLNLMCSQGLTLEGKHEKLSKMQGLTDMLAPHKQLEISSKLSFRFPEVLGLYAVLAKNGANFNEPFSGEKNPDDLLSVSGKTTIEVLEDYAKAMREAREDPAFLREHLHTLNAESWHPTSYNLEPENLSKAEEFYFHMARYLKSIYKEQQGLSNGSARKEQGVYCGAQNER
jgi:hypothetical protein